VNVIVQGIAAGYFPANPGAGKQNCKICDFDNLCSVRREAVWERKRRDPRLSPYVALAGEGEGEQ
jgi:hypothetical protein